MRPFLSSLLLSSLLLFPVGVNASEQSELHQAYRQLEAAKQALKRASQAANAVRHKERVYFDYAKATADIDMVQSGINRYRNSHRAQPRDPRQMRSLSGEYDKVRAAN